jgi:SAM-dependent methyltransferase
MKCRICDNSQGHETFRVREMMFGLKEIFVYFKCPACGCLQITEFPNDLSKYYSSGYYSYSTPASEDPKLKSFLKKKRDRYAAFGRGISGRILSFYFPANLIKLYSGIPPYSRILDVGCGDGSLIWRLKEAGFANVAGIDPFIDVTISYSNGVTVERKSLRDMEGEWNLITYHHSFEHISDPEAELKKVRELISESGTCIIRVPLVDSWAWEHYGTNWVQIDAPRHFYLHSVKSMEILSGQAGFSIDRVEYDSTGFQFWGSEQILNGIHLNSDESFQNNPERSIFDKKQIKDFERKAVILNSGQKGDQAVFFLKKKKHMN